MDKGFVQRVLDYHRFPKPGKLGIELTKPMTNQQDLSLAYTPGVAIPCEEIRKDPSQAALFTSRGNLVAVITNGTAVLGLGAIGPLASKPVMEGKAALFKKFAGIDVFDIEINETDPQKLIEIIQSLEPTFGGINLEDIKAPECFMIEHELTQKLNIPVFHDDQHGTAIIVAAAILNALEIVGKSIETVKIAVSGAGAAAIACLDLLCSFGLNAKNVFLTDSKGVVHEGRVPTIDPSKARYAQQTLYRTLEDIIAHTDIFLGVSTAKVLTPEMVAKMAPNPIVLALANPVPEITPQEVYAVRSDAIVATGRSDYPNQVNNVLCFPYIFRGALDTGATHINEAMKKACVLALAQLAKSEASDIVSAAYGETLPKFGPQNIIPKPFDPRLLIEVAPAVAKAAMESGVATRPIEDFKAYREELVNFVYRSGWVMKPLFTQAKTDLKTIVYSSGEETRVLQAAQMARDEHLLYPLLIGRREVIHHQIQKLGLRLKEEQDYRIIDPMGALESSKYWEAYHHIMARQGVAPALAKTLVLTNPTILGALMVRSGEADALLCGTGGNYHDYLKHIGDIIGLRSGINILASVTTLILPKGVLFVADGYVNPDPNSEEIAEITLLAAEQVRRFGLVPKVGLLSHSNFGSYRTESSHKMAHALTLIRQQAPELEVEGEMQADAALNESVRRHLLPDSRLHGEANLLIMPNIDAANISYNMLKLLGDGLSIGPLLLGLKKPAHILTPSMTARCILNMSAYTVVEAQEQKALYNKVQA